MPPRVNDGWRTAAPARAKQQPLQNLVDGSGLNCMAANCNRASREMSFPWRGHAHSAEPTTLPPKEAIRSPILPAAARRATAAPSSAAPAGWPRRPPPDPRSAPVPAHPAHPPSIAKTPGTFHSMSVRQTSRRCGGFWGFRGLSLELSYRAHRSTFVPRGSLMGVAN